MASGVEVVAVLGGDGTVNEVVNGMRGSDAALGLLGGGRVNVLARGLGLPADPDRAAARLVELLAAGARRRLTLGVAGDRCFVLNAGLGLGGAIVREVERRQRAKQLYGDRAYLAAGLKALLVDHDRDHPHLTVHLPDGRPPLRGFFTLSATATRSPISAAARSGRRPRRPGTAGWTCWSARRWPPGRWCAPSPACSRPTRGPAIRACPCSTTSTASRSNPTFPCHSSSTANMSATGPA